MLVWFHVFLFDLLQILEIDQVKLGAGGVDIFSERVKVVESFRLDPRIRYTHRGIKLYSEKMLIHLFVFKERISRLLLGRSLFG